jgi:hypothetical protein
MKGINKLSRIPPYIRRRIVTLSESGLNNCKIHDTLIREDNVQISRPGTSLFLKRYNATGVIDDQNRGNCAKYLFIWDNLLNNFGFSFNNTFFLYF